VQFAGTAFLTLTGNARQELQERMEKLAASRSAIRLPKSRQPLWVKSELLVKVRHLAGGDTLRHATLLGLEPSDKLSGHARGGGKL
jgi:ATP-dependent DNA ligase